MKRLILLLVTVFGMAACSNEAAPPTVDINAPLSETSIYLMDAAWMSDAQDSVQLGDFRGRPVALSMIYTSCGHACPMIVSDMKKIVRSLPEDALVQYVLVSLDPERDTPERLRDFREAHDLGDEWTLLRSEDMDVRTLAALLDVRYRFEADGNIAHTNRITLLDSGGEIIGRQEGLGVDPASSISIFQEAAGLAL